MYASRYNLVFELDGRPDVLLLNPLAAAMDAVPRDERALLDVVRGQADPGTLEREDLAHLLARGYVVPEPDTEDRRLAELEAADDRDDYPVDFLLFPTFACNLSCQYCFQGDAPSDKQLMDLGHVDAAFEAIRVLLGELRPRATPLLYLFGGEPLLHGRRAGEVVRAALGQARGLGLRTGVITNGATLADQAGLLRENGVEFVQVTLDGVQAVHDRRRPYRDGRGTFDDIVSGIERAVACGIAVYVRVNLDAENLPLLASFADFAHERGWEGDQITVFVGPYRDLRCQSYSNQLPEPAMLAHLLALRRERPHASIIQTLGWPGVDYVHHYLRTGALPAPRLAYCISSYGRFGFDPSGAVYACGTAAGDPRHAVGTYHPRLQLDPERLREWRRRRFTSMDACRRCPAGPLCGGGCTLQSRQKHDGQKPFCPEVVENMRVVLDHYFDDIVRGRP